jgi:amino acid transporter
MGRFNIPFSRTFPVAVSSEQPKSETDVESTRAQDGGNSAFATSSRSDLTRYSASSKLVHTLTESKREIGVWSAFFLIFNRMVGTGIFATPSTIFSLSGSVGLSLFIWGAGMVIASCGMAVYLEFGLAIPKNGGEKNYLEFVYRRPKFLATGFYTGYVVLLGWAGSNSVIFGEYILHAAQVEVNRWNQRGIGLACITTAFLIHGCALKWGLRLQNLIGIIKLLIVLLIVVSGWVSPQELRVGQDISTDCRK